jgi:hypothetical protein
MLGSTKEQRSNRRLLWSGTPDCPVCHRTVSGAPPDSVRCTRGIQLQLVTFGKIQSQRAIIHRTVRCSNGTRLWNSPASGFHEGYSAIIHRTCPVYTGLSGVPVEQRLFRRQRIPAMHLMRAQRAQKSGAPILAHRTMNRRCPVCTGHPGGPRGQKLQRSESNDTGDVAGAPDMSGVHRTCPVCTGLSGAPSNRQPPPTVKFGGWGYKYPNHPHIHGIQAFPLLNHLQELGIQF